MTAQAPVIGAEPLVSLRSVGKTYATGGSAASKLASLWGMLRGRDSSAGRFHALTDVGFDVYPGQSTGLIGANGAGKSTLLKIIAGVVKPSTGDVVVRGRVGALLELGAGFHPEYSGRQNIGLACALMGLSPAQTREREDAIISFADIGIHIDQPVKHYSSGMIVRLGFAVATTLNPQLLITDEVLAVGDESFQRKCITWMENYLGQGGTLLLCSHSMYHIQKLCSHAAWIDGGRLRRHGAADEVTREYLAWHEERAGIARRSDATKAPAGTVHDPSVYHVRGMQLNGRETAEPLMLDFGATLVVSGALHSPDGRPPGVAVGLVRADGTPVYGVYSDAAGYRSTQVGENLFAYRITFPGLPLLPGRYTARSHAMDPEGMRLFDCVERTFEIRGQSREEGFCRLEHTWSTA